MSRSPLDDLRLAIDCLPRRTRLAMLEGVRANEIIVGAYTDRDGGVCPMLAAHRNGGRTSFISFAKAWDAFARVRKGPRKATPREVRILTTMLEASLLGDDAVALRGVIAEHQPTVCVLEGLFFAQNLQTALIMGEARGASLVAAAPSAASGDRPLVIPPV